MTNCKISSAEAKKLAIQVSIISIIGNVILSIFKLVAGLVGNSFAMVSDSIHSMSDVFSTIVVIVGIKISAKSADEKHKFGHERFECVSALILAVILCVTGIGIGRIGIENIFNESYKTFEKPQLIALIGAIVSIVSKEAMFWHAYITSKKIHSSALKADAWHHRSDALSSIGSLIGIGGAMLGVLVLDSIASVVISILIIKVAIEVFVDAIKKMIDESADEKTENNLKTFILTNYPNCEIDEFKTRVFANRIYVDLEIALDKRLLFVDAHNIAHSIHDDIEKHFPYVKHIMIHVNPKQI